MKERRTFLLPPNSGLTKEDVVVTASTLEFSRHKDAAVERRMTLNVTDLPEKVCSFFPFPIRVTSVPNCLSWSSPIDLPKLVRNQ
jgi:hypothetical protein